jgi:hypothetical protein
VFPHSEEAEVFLKYKISDVFGKEYAHIPMNVIRADRLKLTQALRADISKNVALNIKELI